MMRSYLRMMLFALGLLAGVQIPGLVDLYYQRLDARLQQASLGLAPFQRTADQHFNGDLQALIAHYGASQDPVFTQDATSLQQLVSQRNHLQEEFAFRDQAWYRHCAPIPSSGRTPCTTTATWSPSKRLPSSAEWRQA